MPTREARLDRVLLDMNTQCDFLLPRGALPVVNRAEVLPNIRRIVNWGRVRQDPIISSLECHRVGEPSRGFPPHCIEQTNGQRKLPFTLMPRRIVLHGDNTLDVPHEAFRRYQQIIFTKRRDDFLSNPKADRLINAIHPTVFIVFGAGVEYCIKSAVLGLLARKRQIIVARDACGTWCTADCDLAFLQMSAKGCLLATTDEILSGEAEERVATMPLLETDEEELPPMPPVAPETNCRRGSQLISVPVSKGGNGCAKPRRSAKNKKAGEPAKRRPLPTQMAERDKPNDNQAVASTNGKSRAKAEDKPSPKKPADISDLVEIARQKLKSVRKARSRKP